MLRRARTARRPRPCVARARRGRHAGRGAGARARGRRFGRDLLPALVRQPASRAPGGRDPAAGLPGVEISLSAEVAPEFREFYRASTTVINAAVRPIVSRYIDSIEEKLRAVGLHSELLIMQSSGGVYTSGAAREKPVFMVESGPAAGVIAATYLGTSLGYPNVISFDMGGTTAKTCLIQDGTPRVTKDYEVGAKAAPGTGSARGSGYPIRTPVIDLVEIGAGGGSIAWVDAGGILRVGPQSAGADPGPVCYGKGGVEPTVTDANLVLGRLNPEYFLGGGVALDVDAARAAIEVHCSSKLGLDARRGSPRDRRDREHGDGERAPAGVGPARVRPARLRAGRVRRRGAAAREPAGRRDRDRDHARAVERRHHLRDGAPGHRSQARVHDDDDHPRCRRRSCGADRLLRCARGARVGGHEPRERSGGRHRLRPSDRHAVPGPEP